MDQYAPKFHQIYTIFICCDLELVSLKFVICNDSTGVIVGLFILIIIIPPFVLFVLSVDYSSETARDTKNGKIYSESAPRGPANRPVPFTYHQTQTHKTGLKLTIFPIPVRLYERKSAR